MLTHIIGGVKVNVEKVSNMKIVKRIIRITNPKYTHKLTYDYYEPRNTSYTIPLITANFGPITTGVSSVSINNIYINRYVLGDDYEELQQIMKEIESKQTFIKLKREQESLELEEEYQNYMR